MYDRVYIEGRNGKVVREWTHGLNDNDLEFYTLQAISLVAEAALHDCRYDDDLSFALKTSVADHRVIADGKCVAHIRSKDVVQLTRRILRRAAK